MSDVKYDVIIAEAAESDLEALHAYLSETRSFAAADVLLDKIQKVLDTLKAFPQRGSHPNELQDSGESEIRQLIQWPYRVIYEINGTVVEVFAVVDGRRDMRTMLQNRALTR
jgi:toxin ParE1/3/4